MIATARPIQVEALQYDGIYDGAAMQAIEAALRRWTKTEGQDDPDDARAYLGVRVEDLPYEGGRKEIRYPIVHKCAHGMDGDEALIAGAWVVWDNGGLSIRGDAEFRRRYAEVSPCKVEERVFAAAREVRWLLHTNANVEILGCRYVPVGKEMIELEQAFAALDGCGSSRWAWPTVETPPR